MDRREAAGKGGTGASGIPQPPGNWVLLCTGLSSPPAPKTCTASSSSCPPRSPSDLAHVLDQNSGAAGQLSKMLVFSLKVIKSGAQIVRRSLLPFQKLHAYRRICAVLGCNPSRLACLRYFADVEPPPPHSHPRVRVGVFYWAKRPTRAASMDRSWCARSLKHSLSKILRRRGTTSPLCRTLGLDQEGFYWA